jgi:hypothetical protein
VGTAFEARAWRRRCRGAAVAVTGRNGGVGAMGGRGGGGGGGGTARRRADGAGEVSGDGVTESERRGEGERRRRAGLFLFFVECPRSGTRQIFLKF